jgi:nuclear receptor co-repressor 1
VLNEMRKKREDRESLKSVGERIKSEEDLEEIMDGLQEKEMEDKKMS